MSLDILKTLVLDMKILLDEEKSICPPSELRYKNLEKNLDIEM